MRCNMKQVNRIISFILSMCIFISSLPVYAYSENDYESGGDQSYVPQSEYEASLNSLFNQINTRGIAVYSDVSESYSISPSDIDFDTRVTYEINNPIYADYETEKTAVIKFKLSNSSYKTVSFDYEVYPGSALESEHFNGAVTGSVIFEAGETEKHLNINIEKLVNNPESEIPLKSSAGEFWCGDRIFYICCSNIKNALFEEDSECMTVPVKIKNNFDFRQSYNRAKNVYMADISKIQNALVFPDIPGKYKNTGDDICITTGTAIAGDVRTMIDTGIFTHLNLMHGYFLNDEEAFGDVKFIMKRDYIWGSETALEKNIFVGGKDRINFELENVPILELGLGPEAEANGIIRSLGIAFDYSYLTDDIYTVFCDQDDNYLQNQMNFEDKVKPYPVRVGAPEGEFALGEKVPLTVTYNEPILTDNISIKANGVLLYPEEDNGTVSETVSFLYNMGDDFEGTIVIAEIYGSTDVSGKEQEDSESNIYEITTVSLKPYSLGELFSYCSETSIDINQTGNINAHAEIKISVKKNKEMVFFLNEHRQEDGLIDIIKARVVGSDGNAIDVPFYSIKEDAFVSEFRGEFEAPANISSTDIEYVAEIYFDENAANEFILLYSLSKKYTVPHIVYIDDETDFEIIYTGWPDGNKISSGSEDAISLGCNIKNDATWQKPEDFKWSSSDDTIASITTSGAISLTGKAGSVKFGLTAMNAGLPGKQFTIYTDILEVVDTNSAFLNISGWSKNIEAIKGNDVRIYYSTNIMSRNDELGETETATEYFYDLYEAVYDGDELSKGNHVFHNISSLTDAESVFCYTVDKQYLSEISSRDKYSYILEISARDLKTGILFSAAANIRVKSLPARAVLSKPDNFYVTDDQNLSIKFDIENKNPSTEAYLSVTRNDEMTPVFYTDNADDSGKELNISIRAVDSARLYDTYTVSLKARNELDESSSYDSYILYVYNSEAFKIAIDGKNRESFFISAEEFSNMTSEEILDLNRNILLNYDINLNYVQCKWSKILDKIVWSVGDESKISLKYKNGGVINSVDYGVSLPPDTKLQLEGISEGESYVTATHVLTGTESRVDVTVDELRDKLFLFQVYPVQKSQVSYRNGEGYLKTAYTDSSGRIAIYEESGIKGDVEFSPEQSELYDKYILRGDVLKAKQEESNYNGLYVQNNIMFNRSERVVMFNVYVSNYNKDDGYSGDILIKGGVYRNGIYCPNAKINGKDGREEQLVNAPDSICTLNLDPSEFINEIETDPITPDDKIEYVFEINIPEGSCSPVFMKIGSERAYSYKYNGVIFGDIVLLRNNYDSRIENGFNILSQRVVIEGNEQVVPNNVIIEDELKEISLNTEIMYKGDFDSSYEVKFEDKTDNGKKYLTNTEVESHEFSDTVLIKSEFDLQQYATNLEKGEEGILGMQITVKSKSGLDIINLPTNYKVNQFSGIVGLDTLEAGELKEISSEVINSTKGPSLLGSGGKSSYIGVNLDFLSEYSTESKTARLEIMPTDNPLVLRGVIKISVGDLSKYVKSGVYSKDEGASLQYNYMPAYSDFWNNHMWDSKIFMEIYKGGYGSNKKMYGGGAYLDCEIIYDIDDHEWKIVILKSFIHIGGAYHYKHVYNTWIGLVPVTAEFLAGGEGMVGLKTILSEDRSDRIYITELQPSIYIRGFGGIGRDYDVVSLKAGPYGKTELDQRYLWLNSEKKNSNGQRITVKGEVGIEYEIKLIIATIDGSFEIGEVNKTWTYNDYNNINRIYNSSYSSAGLNKLFRSSDVPSLASTPSQDESATFEGRGYLKNDRQWNVQNTMARGVSAEDITAMQTNAYPYSNPVVTSDGELMVYISDMNSEDIKDMSVCFSKKSGGLFPEGDEIDSSGYADTDADVDGTADGAAAAWTRVINDEVYSEGSEASASDIQEMMAGTEIMGAIYDGSGFTTTRLTNNSVPDMSPAVASNGVNAIVAWRSLYAGDISNPLDFDGRNNIMYRIFDGSNWSEEKCLFDGSVDNVVGISAKMLSDGISAITYEVKIKETENTEIYCAVIDETGNIVNNIRITNNDHRDESPRITSAIFPDGKERFIVGWNPRHADEPEERSTIRMASVDGKGRAYVQFESEIEASDTADYSSFKFTDGAERLEDLSVVWVQPDFDSEEYNYSLWGRKFIEDDEGSITISPEVKLLELDKSNIVDFFDSYVDSSGKINFTLQITDYGTKNESSKLAYASAAYSNKLTVNEIYYSNKEILPGTKMPIMFRLYNRGIEPVEGISINLGGDVYESREYNYIMPGEYKDINFIYSVPETIENPDYTIKAEYSSTSDIISGTIKMDVPDVEIYGIDIEKEFERERLLSVFLHNDTFSELTEGRHVIKLNAYDTPDFSRMPIASLTISDSENFDIINGGLLKKNIMLDEDSLMGILKDGEIPDEGVRIFFDAVLEEDGKIIEDADATNNYDYVTIRSLIEKNTEKVSLTSMMNSENGHTRIYVEALNNSFKKISGGNIIVKLKDADEKIIASKQLYDSGAGELSIEGESIYIASFDFSQQGASFDAVYTNDNSGEGEDSGNGSQDKAKDKDQEYPVEYINPFKDVMETDWYYEAIKFVVENGLMIGTETNMFGPGMPVSRGMLATVLYRMEGKPAVGNSSFIDIEKGEYYTDAVAWAHESKIVNGINEIRFGPNEGITREQFASMLYRYAMYKKYSIGISADLSKYSDSSAISEYAVSAIQWAVGNGIIKGREDALLAPMEGTTRAEMAEMLRRFMALYK